MGSHALNATTTPPEPSRLVREIHAKHPKPRDYPYHPPPCRPITAPCMPPSLERWAACPPSSSPASALPTVPPSPALVSPPWVFSGLVVSVLISNNLGQGTTLFANFIQLGAGLSVGLAGLAAGFAIGIVGDAGVRGTAQQPRLFVGMILILIF